MRKKYLYLIIFLFLLFNLSSCDKKVSSEKNYSLTGKINFLTLNNKEYDKNAIGYIKLFKPSLMVDSLNIYKNDYPFVGSSIDPLLSLDYRKLDLPVYETQTNNHGEFSIKNISPDKYLLVYSSDNFGWHTLSLEIDNNLNLELDMKEKRKLSSYIQEDMILGPNEFIELTSDFAILSGAKLTIKENTIFSLANCNITVVGELAIEGTNDKPVLFTSNSNNPQESDWEKIVFTQTSTSRISNAIFQWASIALDFSSPSTIQNIIILNSRFYALYNNSSTLSCSNLTFYNNDSGCYISSETNLQNNTILDKSLFINTKKTAIYIQTASPIIKNSIFLSNDIDINAYWDSFPKISHSIFDNSFTTSLLSSKRYDNSQNISVTYCDFKNNNIDFHFQRGANSIINNNNFIQTENFVIKLSYYYGGTQVNAQRNWWATTNENKIQELIWDQNDDNENDIGYVDYSYWKTTKVSPTGPQNNNK